MAPPSFLSSSAPSLAAASMPSFDTTQAGVNDNNETTNMRGARKLSTSSVSSEDEGMASYVRNAQWIRDALGGKVYTVLDK